MASFQGMSNDPRGDGFDAHRIRFRPFPLRQRTQHNRGSQSRLLCWARRPKSATLAYCKRPAD
eukprot:11572340-Alexandrium_andersonii.AAC.1